MVNNLLVQGIKMAVERGASLENAMMSFYNAGYLKEEIEEAARAYQMGDRYQPTSQKSVAPITTRPLPTSKQPIQNISSAKKQQIPISQNYVQTCQSSMQNIQSQNQYPTKTINSNQSFTQSPSPQSQQYPVIPQSQFQQYSVQTTNKHPKKIKQKASHYGIEDTKSKTKAAIIILIIILLLLIGSLIILFLFKNSLIDFFNITF